MYILAEIGINHDGSIKKAKELIDASKEAGADGVKFQLIRPETLLSPFTYENDEKIENPVLNIFKKYELPIDDYVELAEYCKNKEIDFLCTTFDTESLEFLDPYLEMHKISSGDITHVPLLKAAGATKKPVIISTGMADLSMVRHAVNAIKDGGGREITLLHCVSCYPPVPKEVNLSAITTLKEEFGYPVGFSDHTEGSTAAIAAYTLGATFLEKHVTFNKKDEGADHCMSMEMNDFAQMIKNIRNLEKMMGSGEKVPCEREIEISKGAFRGLYAKKDIKKGDKVSIDDILIARPSNTLKPVDVYSIENRIALRDICYGDDLVLEDFS